MTACVQVVQKSGVSNDRRMAQVTPNLTQLRTSCSAVDLATAPAGQPITAFGMNSSSLLAANARNPLKRPREITVGAGNIIRTESGQGDMLFAKKVKMLSDCHDCEL
jgi:hypothetical protein